MSHVPAVPVSAASREAARGGSTAVLLGTARALSLSSAAINFTPCPALPCPARRDSERARGAAESG
jgi:hypothetical protein